MRFKNWLIKNYMKLSVAVLGGTAFLPAGVYADAFSNAAEGAAMGIQASAAGAAKWLIMIVLVIPGLLLIIGTQRQKDNLKEQAPLVILGVALILGAAGVANMVFGWF